MSESTFEYDLFISFASDDQALVRPLWQDLTGAGLRVFWSDSTLRERVGSSWFDVIQQSLTQSRHLLVIFSLPALRSEWVRREYVAFFSHYYRPPSRLLVPVLARDATFNDIPLFLRELEACRLDDSGLSRRLIRLFGGTDIEALRSELAARNEEIDTLSSQLISMRGELELLRAHVGDVVALESELVVLRDETATLRDGSAMLQTERDSLQARVEALARRVSNDGGAHQRERERLLAERTALTTRIGELQTMVNEWRANVGRPKIDISSKPPTRTISPDLHAKPVRLQDRDPWTYGGIRLWAVTSMINVILLVWLSLASGSIAEPTVFLFVIFGVGAVWFFVGATARRKGYALTWLLVPAGVVVCLSIVISSNGFLSGIFGEGPVALIGLWVAKVRQQR